MYIYIFMYIVYIYIYTCYNLFELMPSKEVKLPEQRLWAHLSLRCIRSPGVPRVVVAICPRCLMIFGDYPSYIFIYWGLSSSMSWESGNILNQDNGMLVLIRNCAITFTCREPQQYVEHGRIFWRVFDGGDRGRNDTVCISMFISKYVYEQSTIKIFKHPCQSAIDKQ